MDQFIFWLNIRVPLWTLFVTVFTCVLAGYLIGHQQKRGEVKEAVDAEFVKRRNDLFDRGRTTDRRPEHDGMQPAVNRRIKVVGTRPTPPDRPRNQL
ncbi:MAG: hypothetical protein IPK85_03125 [Gemmatimonadetes bacterium]|nr:hypothetical protein [Gemmatimonadota bacterium]